MPMSDEEDMLLICLLMVFECPNKNAMPRIIDNVHKF